MEPVKWAYELAGQGRHEVWSAWSWYWSTAHGVQPGFTVLVLVPSMNQPAGQLQGQGEFWQLVRQQY